MSDAVDSMLIAHDYRGHRISSDAARTDDGAWNAEVRVTQVFTYGQEKPYVDIVTCRKATAEAAEKAAMVWGQNWVDRHADRYG